MRFVGWRAAIFAALLMLFISPLSAQQANIPTLYEEYDLVLLSPERVRFVSPAAHYVVIDKSGESYARILDRELQEVLLLDKTQWVAFINETQLYHISGYETQMPRIYDIETGQYSSAPRALSVMESLIWREPGQDFFYSNTLQGDLKYFYQSADLATEPVLVSGVGTIRYYNGGFLLSADKTLAYVATASGIVEWEVESQATLRTIDVLNGHSMDITPDGRYLSVVSANEDHVMSGTLRIIDLYNGDTVIFEAAVPNGGYVDISPDGEYFAYSVGADRTDGFGKLFVMSLPDVELLYEVPSVLHGNYGRTKYGLPNATRYFTWLDSQTLAYLENPNNYKVATLAFYNMARGELLSTGVSGWLRTDTVLGSVRFITLDEATHYMHADMTEAILISPYSAQPFISGDVMGFGYGVFVKKSSNIHEPLPMLLARTNSPNINVRSYPSANGARLVGITGTITLAAVTSDKKWVYVAEAAGWVSADLLTIDGNIETLTNFNPK